MSFRDYLPTTGYLSAEVDGRADGLNQGRTSFSPGSTPHVLVHAGPGVIVSGVDASAGSLFPGARQVFQVEEDLVFSGSNQVRLSKPARSLDTWIWMGRDLGGLILEPDGITITASSAGLAVARLKNTVETAAWGLSSPNTLGGENAFPVQGKVVGVSHTSQGPVTTTSLLLVRNVSVS